MQLYDHEFLSYGKCSVRGLNLVHQSFSVSCDYDFAAPVYLNCIS